MFFKVNHLFTEHKQNNYQKRNIKLLQNFLDSDRKVIRCRICDLNFQWVNKYPEKYSL